MARRLWARRLLPGRLLARRIADGPAATSGPKPRSWRFLITGRHGHIAIPDGLNSIWIENTGPLADIYGGTTEYHMAERAYGGSAEASRIRQHEADEPRRVKHPTDKEG
nr:hypothetical protein GCM10010200_017730 [Actinomadura rugatobispora]